MKGQKSQEQITFVSFLPKNKQKSFLTIKGGYISKMNLTCFQSTQVEQKLPVQQILVLNYFEKMR